MYVCVCVQACVAYVYAVEARGQYQIPSYIAFYLICLFTYSKVFILCLWVFGLPVRVCTMYVLVSTEARGVLDPLGLELQMFVGCDVAAGNQTQVLWKNS